MRPKYDGLTLVLYIVSIHALLAECDLLRGGGPFRLRCFNPRTPCGVRRNPASGSVSGFWFQSTHSLRSATICIGLETHDYMVSIHALLAECDRATPDNKTLTKSFNPRTPCGVRRFLTSVAISPVGFNPRTPCGVRLATMPPEHNRARFQSTHSLRSATNGVVLEV